MAQSKTWSGSCHCGAVRYEVDADLEGLITCNCSRCARTRAILKFVPADQFRLLDGDEDLKDYQFNKHVIHHLFCTSCGIESFARGTGPDGKPMVAINVGCLDGVDVHTLEPMKFDGRSR